MSDEHSNTTKKGGNPSISRRKVLGAVASLSALTALPSLSMGSSSSIHPSQNLPSSISTIQSQGTSSQFTTFDLDTKEKAYPIQPGEKKNIIHYRGAGIITRMWMTISGWFWMYWEPETYTDPTILKKLILRIYWDENDYPSVEAPIGDFFGIGQCEYKPYLSQFLGMSSGGFYNYFPMPFSKGVRIEVENLHDKVVPYVFLNANYQAIDELPESEGRFHCLYNAGTNPGQDPTPILKAKGEGHFVGCCLSMQGKEKNYLSFLEAPEYFYIDKDKKDTKPTFVGTGLEDYFNGGWYFRNGTFNGPYHGVPIKDSLRSMISMYRFHHQDAVRFNKNIKMEFLNPRKASPFKFSSTAYWYQKKAARLAFQLPAKGKLVDWYRIRDTDHQSIP